MLLELASVSRRGRRDRLGWRSHVRFTGVEEAALIVAAVGAVTGAGVGIQQAQAKNRAVKRSLAAAQQAAAVQGTQVSRAAALEQEKNRLRSEQILGRLRVAAAESGLDDTGSFENLYRQADVDAALNSAIIKQNRNDQLARVASGYQADIVSIGSQAVNPILAAFTSGIGGLQTGLAIGGAVTEANRSPSSTPAYSGYEGDYVPASNTTGDPYTRYA